MKRFSARTTSKNTRNSYAEQTQSKAGSSPYGLRLDFASPFSQCNRTLSSNGRSLTVWSSKQAGRILGNVYAANPQPAIIYTSSCSRASELLETMQHLREALATEGRSRFAVRPHEQGEHTPDFVASDKEWISKIDADKLTWQDW